MHYGTEIRHSISFSEAEKQAVARHSHYYTDAAGWLYRVVANRYAAIQPYADPVSGDGEWYTTDPKLEVFAFPVMRWTPCGARIRDIHGQRRWANWREVGDGTRFVNLTDGGKQYASRTVEEAIRQLAARREAQLRVLSGQERRAKRELQLCEQALTREKDT